MNKMIIKKKLIDIAEGIGSALYLTSMIEDDELRHRFVLELSKINMASKEIAKEVAENEQIKMGR